MKTEKYPTMTRTQIAQKYQVCLKTLNKMLLLIPDFALNKNLRTLTPKQVALIHEHLGEPPD
jgi:hypothetical protein